MSIEAAAYDVLWEAGAHLTTFDIVALLKARGFRPSNMTTTLLSSARIFSEPREHPTDRYRWFVDKTHGRIPDF